MRREAGSVTRYTLDGPEDAPALLAALEPEAGGEAAVSEAVAETLAAVRKRGDLALVDEVRRHDWACPGPEALRVPKEALESAWTGLRPSLKRSLKRAEASIRAFHAGQRPARCKTRREGGLRAGVRTLPLGAVGLYVPGGRAAYPTTLLMLAVPAQIARVRRIAVASPAGAGGLPSPAVLAAARLLGLGEVYAVGGAAAVGAFAFGTRSVPRVDKVFGPGNAYVAEAKRRVFGAVGIDAIAGPTELVVLSDGSSPAPFIAADLLAQAEHDALATAILLTTDGAEPARVLAAIEGQLQGSPRAAIQRESLRKRGALVTCPDGATACAVADALAPEHLSVQARNPRAWARRVPRAAAVFLGPFTPEAAGDYGAGPNHSLPTGGTARFASPVCVWDFFRYQSYLEMNREALNERASWMGALAEAEGLFSHGRSLAVRGGGP